jgi:hypothetical protein
MNDPLYPSMLSILSQGELLLKSLSDEAYTQTVDLSFPASIGSHYRHSLEHFDPLLTPPDGDLIDYDARKRDTALETDRTTALSRTREFMSRAQETNMTATGADRKVWVTCSVSADSESPVVESTSAREIMFAVIHAVHHYAIIRMMCSGMEKVRLPKEFGMAPSTTRHRRHLTRA